MPKRKRGAKKNSHPAKKSDQKTIAILALVLNLLILPGLGTIVGGKTKEGIAQIILAIVGIALMFILIGIPIFIAAWIWGLVSGIKLINKVN